MPLPRGLRRECEALLATLPIPQPFTVQAFADNLAQQRGRPIVFEPMPEGGPPDSPSGLWVALRSVDVIFYMTRTSLPHQTLIQLHELGHIAAGHRSQIDLELVARAFPAVDREFLREALALPRAGYTNRDEQQAELLALLLADHLGADDGSTPAARRLTETLTHPVEDRGWRGTS
ncbi:hypothetical protein [Kitasatospora griseola]